MKPPPVVIHRLSPRQPAFQWALYLALAALAVGAAAALLLMRYVVAALVIALPAAVWFSLCFAESHYVRMALAAWRDRHARPTGPPAPAPGATPAPPLTPRAALALAAAAGALVAGADVLTPNLNLAILHVPVLLLYLSLSRRRAPWALALLLAELTYLAYFFKPLNICVPEIDRLHHFRMANRTMVVAVLLALSAASPWLPRLPQPGAPRRRRPRRAAARLDRALACLAAAGLLAVILAVDLWAPACYNLPILFVLPLALGAWGGGARLLWLLALVGIAGAWADLLLPAHAPVLPYTFWVNRGLALGVALGLLLLLRAWLRRTPAR